MNGGAVPNHAYAGLPAASPLQMTLHPDDQMFLDVFAQDLTQTGAWPADGLPPLDFASPDSPATEYPQARSCAVPADDVAVSPLSTRNHRRLALQHAPRPVQAS